MAIREAGGDPLARTARPRLIGSFMPKFEELVDRSKGKIRADVAYRPELRLRPLARRRLPVRPPVLRSARILKSLFQPNGPGSSPRNTYPPLALTED